MNTNETDPVAEPTTPTESLPVTPPTATGQDSRAYFKKVLLNHPFVVNKVRIPFEPLARNIGVLVIDPLNGQPIKDGDHEVSAPVAFEALFLAARGRRGGVISINEQVYHDLKKKFPAPIFEPKSKPQRLRVWPDPNLRKSKNQNTSAPAAPNTISSAPAAANVGGVRSEATGSGPDEGKHGESSSAPATAKRPAGPRIRAVRTADKPKPD